MQKKLKAREFLNDKRGFGVEDAPFQIAAAVIVLLVTVGIGAYVLNSFQHGNECQKASEAALEIQKYARLVSAGSEGSRKIISVGLPDESSITFDGDILLYTGEGCVGNKTLSVEGISIQGNQLGPGSHNLKLIYVKSGSAWMVNVSKI
ncbi:MAG: hypothetical protein A7315_07455 [Candidatus Altiarchaeales archaeon WOR_SM1_79]|nr:MAG: hypothetical protein A7315_07455 [Candidatus Altiarchaeales archaeon WOR_SM1_79]